MSKDTFPFTTTSLRSLRLEQEHQDWENARRALAQRRAMTRAPLAPAPRPPPAPSAGRGAAGPGQRRLQVVRAPPPAVRCRDAAVHNTFMCGDMRGVYALLKDPAMVNALMETVHEEMVWTPEMGVYPHLRTRPTTNTASRPTTSTSTTITAVSTTLTTSTIDAPTTTATTITASTTSTTTTTTTSSTTSTTTITTPTSIRSQGSN